MQYLPKLLFLFFVFGAFSIVTPQTANAQALGGFDTVSYFSGGPKRGKAEFSTQWNGQTWLFSSASNLRKFEQNPAKFAPQYGGQCAFAVAHGSSAPGDPRQWHVHRGKLYLNLNSSIKRQWLANKEDFIKRADRNF